MAYGVIMLYHLHMPLYILGHLLNIPTKSKFFRNMRKKHTGNFAVYVTNRKHSGK